MSTPTFSKTHNLITYIEKPTKSEGFIQIIDFLNGSSVKYALTVSPTIHTSCIKQLWTSTKVKKVNDEVRIQALVNGKRVNIKESLIRHILRLDDAEDTSCLTNIENFECLARMRKHTKEPKVPPTKSQVEHNVPLPLPSHDPLPSGEDSLKLKELMDLCTNLSNKVLDLESKVIHIKSTYKAKFEQLESKVERLEEENRVLKELNALSEAYNLDLDNQEKVLSMLDVNDEEPAGLEEVLEVVTAAKLITKVVTNAGVDVKAASVQDTPITTVEAAKVIDEFLNQERKERKPLTEAQARRNMIVYLKNMAGYKMNYFKGKSYAEIIPLFEKHYNYNQSFQNKKQNMEQKTEELKKRLQIVPDDDDDVYADATPLASKIPIVYYKIHTERNRRYFMIIRADGNHRLFMSFSTMIKNFDREDLESLWKIIRERFEKTEPKYYTDDYLLNTLKIMFEKPDVEANMWKD
uniref:Xylulose kinase-1 n=1 Tax=Tanacetum cinerariifolium TaxID=118510 RepID=A0A699HV88_TANCI|nr:hypothetical protein [Tanacetum cinerariifolium]